MVTPKRDRHAGRPRLSSEKSDAVVGARVTASDYTRIYQQAKAERVSISEWVRRALFERREGT